MTGREDMLARIRKALGHTTPASARSSALEIEFPKLDAVVPVIPAQDLVSTFEAEFAKVSGVAHRASNPSELEGVIRSILESGKATSIALTRNPQLEHIKLGDILRGWGKSVEIWPPLSAGAPEAEAWQAYRDQCFSAQVGISGVDFVLAETGTLVVTSHTEGSQLASLAPPVHVALYTRAQVVGSLEEVLEKLPVAAGPNQSALGRSFVLITGTSRTADIEQILIRGVHGPGEIHAILVEDACRSATGNRE